MPFTLEISAVRSSAPLSFYRDRQDENPIRLSAWKQTLNLTGVQDPGAGEMSSG